MSCWLLFIKEKKNAEERILKAKRSPQEGKTNPNTHFLDFCIVFFVQKKKEKQTTQNDVM